MLEIRKIRKRVREQKILNSWNVIYSSSLLIALVRRKNTDDISLGEMGNIGRAKKVNHDDDDDDDDDNGHDSDNDDDSDDEDDDDDHNDDDREVAKYLPTKRRSGPTAAQAEQTTGNSILRWSEFVLFFALN